MAEDEQQRDLRKHVYLPVPNINDLPKTALSKPEMLSTIISNLDKSHQMVRNNIIAEAKAKQTRIPQPPHQSTNTAANRAAAESLFLANLNAPAPLKDPKLPPDGAIPPPPRAIVQETPPAEIQLAKETAELLERYDKNARQTRNFYQDALARIENPDPRNRRASGANSIPPPPPPPPPPHPPNIITSGFPRAMNGYGSVSASPAERALPGSANASPWSGGTSPRDPRLRGRRNDRGEE